ncbi:MAG: hypothetical protein P8Y91_10105 [Desulfuromonadales bacterium]
MKKQKPLVDRPKPDNVFREAWQNMNADLSRILPGFLSRRLQQRKGKLWVVILMTLFELLVLGVIGKLLYDWWTA